MAFVQTVECEGGPSANSRHEVGTGGNAGIKTLQLGFPRLGCLSDSTDGEGEAVHRRTGQCSLLPSRQRALEPGPPRSLLRSELVRRSPVDDRLPPLDSQNPPAATLMQVDEEDVGADLGKSGVRPLSEESKGGHAWTAPTTRRSSATADTSLASLSPLLRGLHSWTCGTAPRRPYTPYRPLALSVSSTSSAGPPAAVPPPSASASSSSSSPPSPVDWASLGIMPHHTEMAPPPGIPHPQQQQRGDAAAPGQAIDFSNSHYQQQQQQQQQHAPHGGHDAHRRMSMSQQGMDQGDYGHGQGHGQQGGGRGGFDDSAQPYPAGDASGYHAALEAHEGQQQYDEAYVRPTLLPPEAHERTRRADQPPLFSRPPQPASASASASASAYAHPAYGQQPSHPALLSPPFDRRRKQPLRSPRVRVPLAPPPPPAVPRAAGVLGR